MESRTSPGKRGSVQPISEFLMGVSHLSLVLGCKSFLPVEMGVFPIVSGGFVVP